MANYIGVTEKETSSAASHYYDAPLKWIKSQGAGVAKWASHASLDPGKFFSDAANQIGEIWKNVTEIRKILTPGGIANFYKDIWGKVFNKGKRAVNGFLNPLLIVKNKILGAFNTPEGKGLAALAAGASALLGGGVLLGAGPETINGMLRGVQLLYQLNWTESDEDIEKQIQGSITGLYSSAGSAVGTGLASLVTGGVFKLPRVQINVTKVSILWRALNEEARSEMLAQLRNLARTAFFTGLRIFIKTIYRSARKWFKQWAKANPNHPLVQAIPGGMKSIEAWGSGGPPWSFSQYVNKKIENLQENPLTKNIGVFLEQAVEEFFDGISDFLPELVRTPIV